MDDETKKGWLPDWAAWAVLGSAFIIGVWLVDVLIKAAQ